MLPRKGRREKRRKEKRGKKRKEEKRGKRRKEERGKSWTVFPPQGDFADLPLKVVV